MISSCMSNSAIGKSFLTLPFAAKRASEILIKTRNEPINNLNNTELEEHKYFKTGIKIDINLLLLDDFDDLVVVGQQIQSVSGVKHVINIISRL